MIPVKTPDCNFTFTAPANTKPGEVGDLSCYRGHGYTKSWWKPEEAERIALAAGGLIEFTVFMDGHPVVSLGACQPVPLNGDDPVVTPAMAAMIHKTLVAWNFATIFPDAPMPDLGVLDGFSLIQLCTAVLMHEAARPKQQGIIQPTIDERWISVCYTFMRFKLRPQDEDHEVLIHDGKQALYMAWGKGQNPNGE